MAVPCRRVVIAYHDILTVWPRLVENAAAPPNVVACDQDLAEIGQRYRALGEPPGPPSIRPQVGDYRAGNESGPGQRGWRRAA